jgi:hypothetical protein
MYRLNWKKIKSIKLQKIKIFDSTFYFRHTVRTILALILIWLGMVAFFNWNFLVRSASFSQYLFITQDVDSIRYLLSSAFQGLAALFALTISVSFVVAQLASSYSPRLVMKIVRKRWFVFGLTLFVVSLTYNLFLLSFVTNETVIGFKPWLLFGNVLDIASIIFIIPFVFLFIRTIDPWELSQGLAKKFNEAYFEKMTKKREVDDTLPLFQTFVIKGLENGDLDMVSVVLSTFFSQLEKFITSENYHLVATYFKPFFYKLIRKATEYKENTILEQLIFSFERVQNKITSSDFMKVSKFQDEYFSSMPHMILFLMNESIKFGDGEMLGVGFGALSRLEKKLVPMMPVDDVISEIRSMKEMMNKNYDYRNGQEEYDNDNIFEYIDNVFLADEMVMLAETAIKIRNKKATSRIIRHIFYARHDIFSLDEKRIEVKKRIFGSLPYHLREIMKSASNNSMGITDNIVTGTQELLREIVDMDSRTAEYYVSLMCDALMLMIKKEYFTTSPEWILNMAGAVGRGIISKKNKEVGKITKEIIETFKRILALIDERSKKSIGSEYEKIRNEIATQLKSFQSWGLKEVDENMDKELGEFLTKNWNDVFLKSLDKPTGQRVGN